MYSSMYPCTYETPEYQYFNTVLAGHLGRNYYGISTTLFDTFEELVWVGNYGGFATSFYSTNLEKYTSFQVHKTEEIRSIVALESGIIALTRSQIRGHIRRGLHRFTFRSPHFTDLQCMILSRDKASLLLSGQQKQLHLYDMASTSISRSVDVGENGCVLMSLHQNYTCCGDTAGNVMLCDPKSLVCLHNLRPHSASLNDMDVRHNLLVTCGVSYQRMNQATPDRYLTIYDLRMHRMVQTTPLLIDPYLLKFIPALSSRMLVVSSLGHLQAIDVVGPSNAALSQVETNGNHVTCFDVSSSSQLLSFCDQGGGLTLFSMPNQESRINNISIDTEFADDISVDAYASYRDHRCSLSTVPLPVRDKYLSDMPVCDNEYKYSRVCNVSAEILSTMRVNGGIGYTRVCDTGSSQTDTLSHSMARTALDSAGGTDIPSVVPYRYRKSEQKHSARASDERAPATPVGLEACGPGAYCVVLIQAIYRCVSLRSAIKHHLCLTECCITCELNFLFHMMENTEGSVCQPTNFLRAFRTLPEACRCNLTATESITQRNTFLALVQNANVFLMNQIDRFIRLNNDELLYSSIPPSLTDNSAWPDISAANPKNSTSAPHKNLLTQSTMPASADPVQTAPSTQPATTRETSGDDVGAETSCVFSQCDADTARCLGTHVSSHLTCTVCDTAFTQDHYILTHNIWLPDVAADNRVVSFESVILDHLLGERSVTTFCRACKRRELFNKLSHVQCYSNVLCFNIANVFSEKARQFWLKQTQLLNLGVPQWLTSTDHEFRRPCRYADDCSRAACKFWHQPHDTLLVSDNAPSGSTYESALHSCTQLSAWLAPRLRLRHQHEESSGGGVCLYEIRAIVSHVSSSQSCHPGHFVVSVCTGRGSCAQGDIGRRWYLINEGSVVPVLETETLWHAFQWKTPVSVYYERCDVNTSFSTKSILSLSDFLISTMNHKQISSEFYPLTSSDMPNPGDIVAIDAEFVTVNHAEKELRSDGTRTTITPSVLTPARVTCVRGYGPKQGIAFIDDYIVAKESVVDYMTHISGIESADLNKASSSKPLTTLKLLYLKLKCLLDRGVVFVGHGLQNDFKVINIVVPSSQIRDTVDIFHLPQHRMVSLKFLAWHFLHILIQCGTHCSIEDARTALRLYRIYESLLNEKGEQGVRGAVAHLYEVGQRLNWTMSTTIR